MGTLIPAVLVSPVTAAPPFYSYRCSQGNPEFLSSLSSVFSLTIATKLLKISPMEAKDYTQDGTVNLRGDPVLASQTGKWKACSFLVGIYLLSYQLSCLSLFYFILILG